MIDMVMKDEPPTLEDQIRQSISQVHNPPPVPLSSLDVNGDGHVSPVDALLVINLLNAMPAA